ncbi:hypothetical protein [Nocardia asteroides]
MAPNSDRYLLSNGADRVSLFYDGRVKVWSRSHLWTILESGRPNALGEFVRIGVGQQLDVRGPIGAREKPHFTTSIDPTLGGAAASTITADNGTFVVFHHDGSITVGNDGRDIEETFNGGREVGIESGRGGSVMIFFSGSYRCKSARRSDYHVLIPIPEVRPCREIYPGEYEFMEGKVGPRGVID